MNIKERQTIDPLKLTAIDILIDFLVGRAAAGLNLVPQHILEYDLPEYGWLTFGKRYNPSTYARKFREIKAGKWNVPVVIQLHSSEGAENIWHVILKSSLVQKPIVEFT